jgi:hypothetical protein
LKHHDRLDAADRSSKRVEVLEDVSSHENLGGARVFAETE